MKKKLILGVSLCIVLLGIFFAQNPKTKSVNNLVVKHGEPDMVAEFLIMEVKTDNLNDAHEVVRYEKERGKTQTAMEVEYTKPLRLSLPPGNYTFLAKFYRKNPENLFSKKQLVGCNQSKIDIVRGIISALKISPGDSC